MDIKIIIIIQTIARNKTNSPLSLLSFISFQFRFKSPINLPPKYITAKTVAICNKICHKIISQTNKEDSTSPFK